jgi:hypothetical protein
MLIQSASADVKSTGFSFSIRLPNGLGLKSYKGLRNLGFQGSNFEAPYLSTNEY